MFVTSTRLRSGTSAVFPNRCEGGTNLVAMEALTAGLPCVGSANSGHMDLLGPDGTASRHCYPLAQQTPVSFGPDGSEYWRESDVDEIVERLEEIYQDRETARQKGAAARSFMTDWSWENQIGKLLTEMDRLT